MEKYSFIVSSNYQNCILKPQKIIYYIIKKGIVAFNFLRIKELKGVLKEAGNDKVAEVQLRIALLCIISNISLTQR